MYNPQKVIDLIESNGYQKKELLDYMGKNWNGSLDAVIRGDIRVSKLEKIADFFGVPVDTFFDRENSNNGVQIGGVRNRVHHFTVGTAQGLKAIIDEKDKLIEEKDKRIKLLEDMVELYRAQPEKRGQISDSN